MTEKMAIGSVEEEEGVLMERRDQESDVYLWWLRGHHIIAREI